MLSFSAVLRTRVGSCHSLAVRLVFLAIGTFVSSGLGSHALAASSVPILTGEGFDLGQEQGRVFNNEITSLFNEYVLPEVGSPSDWVWALNLARHLEVRISDKRRAEIAGIAAATGLSYDQVLVGNLIPELGQQLGRPVACSTFVALPGRSVTGALIVGRNLDFGHPEILSRLVRPYVLAENGAHRIFSVGFPGMVGVLTAINEKLVSLSQMYSFHNDQDAEGIPTSFLYRDALAVVDNLSQAMSYLQGAAPRATATNTMATDSTDAAVLEMTAHHFAVRRPEATGTLYSANHFEDQSLIGSRSPGRDWRWGILSRLDHTATAITFDDVRSLIADAGRGMGNVLSFFVDYGRAQIYFGTQGQPTAEGPLTDVAISEVFP